MRAILYFLLGFALVFSVAVAYASYPGECTVTLAKSSTSMPGYSFATWSLSSGGILTKEYPYSFNSSATIYEVSHYYYENNSWYSISQLYAIFGTPGPGTVVPSQYNLANIDQLVTAGYLSCKKECPDSDSDGICDACDPLPDDSGCGGDDYLKGYYEYNGQIVATISSCSATNDSYDVQRVTKDYSGNITDVPGYVLGLGTPSHIITNDFIDGGGKFTGLVTPEKTSSTKCAPVENASDCENVPCDVDTENLAAEKKHPESSEPEKPTTEDKQDKAPYLNPDQPCENHRSLCSNSCGGSPLVQNFGCSSGGHVICDCASDGGYELAPSWNDIGNSDSSSEEDDSGTGTVGSGTSTTGGGSSTSAGGGEDIDGDGTVDGSPYEYVEGKVDYSPIGAAFGRLGGKFPFSLRHSISDLYSSFRHAGAAPSYTYSIYGRSLTISLSAWNDIAQMVRSLFALGIALSTILMLIYLYSGIDLRGKA